MVKDSKDKRIAILQPGYLPWLGFFEQMCRSDIFVFLDDVQFTKNDWRNRNRIKTKQGVSWLTVPVIHKFGQKILDVRIDERSAWRRKHLQSIRMWYGKSRYLDSLSDDLENIYSRSWGFLVDLDLALCLLMKERLGIGCDLLRSSELGIKSDDRNMRLVEICVNTGANHFYEGKAGEAYMDIELFRRHNINVEFQDYHHPYYEQLWMNEQGFVSHLSAIDLLLNYGPESAAVLSGDMSITPPEGVMIRHADILAKKECRK